MAIKGLAAMKRKLKKLEKQFPDAMADALYESGERIMSESVREVPVKTGRLRATHYVEEPKKDSKGKHSLEIGYGTNYAVSVHENMTAKHTVGKAKYLQDPINKARSTWARDLVNRVEKHASKRGLL